METEARMEANEPEEKWRQVANCSADYILILDRACRIQFANRAAPDLPEKETLGRQIWDFVPTASRSVLRECCEGVLATGKPGICETEYVDPSDNRLFFENRVAPLTCADRVVGLVVNASDITERRKAEEALRVAHETLEARVLQRTEELRATNARLRREIAERERAEQALHAREASFQALADNANEGIAIISGERLVYANRRCAEIVHYLPEEAAGMSLGDFICPEERSSVREAYAQRVRGEAVGSRFESGLLCKDGSTVPADVSATTILWEGERAAAYIITDLTERKRREGALQEREARLQTIYDNPAIGIAITDPEGRPVQVNKRCQEMFGYADEDKPSAISPNELTHPDDEARSRQARKDLAQGKLDFFQMEKRYVRKDGGTFWAHLSTCPIRGQDGRVEAFFVVIVDTTERKNAELALLRIRAQERERIRRDLHDSVGQDLIGSACMAKSLARKIIEYCPPLVGEAQGVVEGIQQAMADLQMAVKGLSPVDADPHGLMVALEGLAARTEEQCEVRARFECRTPVAVHDNDAATHLFRIAQEATNNAVKHAQAQSIVILLTDGVDHIGLTIRDDGCGIGEREEEPEGMGLRVMRYRAEVLGATLLVERADEQGTSVTCLLPRRGHDHR